MKNQLLPDGFRCGHCRTHISTDRFRSGVCHRNHCPYCLWSRHVDWRSPGDRLSACKGMMRPVGLALKRIRKTYGGFRDGELTVIHQCVQCARLSINRIAADDCSTTLADLYFSSLVEIGEIQAELDRQEIRMLQRSDWETVSRRLFGGILPFGDNGHTGTAGEGE